MAFAPLDPELHNQLRLAIMGLLVAVEEGDLDFLLERTGATRGNLRTRTTRLREAGCLRVRKRFKDSYPNTACSVTAKGLAASGRHVGRARRTSGSSRPWRVVPGTFATKARRNGRLRTPPP